MGRIVLKQERKFIMMRFVIYSKSNCPNCVTAKNLLVGKGLDFEEKSVEEGTNMLELLGSYPDARQMPQVFVDGQRVGGLAGLQAALKTLGL